MNKIRKIRQAQGLTMRQLGDAIGCTEAAISFYERGLRQPDNDTLVRIASTLNVSVDDLLGVSAGDEPLYSTRIPQIAMMGREMEKMTPEQRDQMLAVGKALFKEYFGRGEDDGT